MKIIKLALIALCCGLLSSCVSNQALTKEEMAIQNKADEAVAGALFEQEMEALASYNVHKDGFVVIQFDESVSFASYNEMVKILRADPAIRGVRAEQGGAEVCPLKH